MTSKLSVFFLIAGFVFLAAEHAKAEYTWNGQDWVWNEEESPAQEKSNVASDVDDDFDAGSGGYDDDADNDRNKGWRKKNNNNNKKKNNRKQEEEEDTYARTRYVINSITEDS